MVYELLSDDPAIEKIMLELTTGSERATREEFEEAMAGMRSQSKQ